MRQSGKTRFVYGGNEHSTSNPNGFGHVVVFPDLSVGADVLDMLKDHNKPGGRFQKGLFPIRPNGGQILQPAVRSTTRVERLFFLFSSFTNSPF